LWLTASFAGASAYAFAVYGDARDGLSGGRLLEALGHQ
jgi:hypothetical protein